MPRPDHFLSCDWGTSSFRLRCVRWEDLAVLGEVRTGEGAKVIHQRLVEDGRGDDPMARIVAFGSVMQRGIEAVLEQTGGLGGGAPVMVSGMASSTVGWRELPYGLTPCGLDGGGLRVEAIGAIEIAGSGENPVWMTSGLSTGSDVMRGEETEWLGVMALPELSAYRERSFVVLPGTHSKHVRVEGGAIVDFRTYMTGELLEVLCQHSLLRVSVVWPPPQPDTTSEAGRWRAELRAGAIQAREWGLARCLFQVRARSVLRRVEPAGNAWFLAGLVMGAEVLDLLEWEGSWPIALAGGVPFAASYSQVFEALGAAHRLMVVPPERLVASTIRAHGLLLERMKLWR